MANCADCGKLIPHICDDCWADAIKKMIVENPPNPSIDESQF